MLRAYSLSDRVGVVAVSLAGEAFVVRAGNKLKHSAEAEGNMPGVSRVQKAMMTWDRQVSFSTLSLHSNIFMHVFLLLI